MRILNEKIPKRRFNFELFSMGSLGVVFLLIFAFIPMFGIIIAFKDLDYSMNIMDGIFSPNNWVGFSLFKEFLTDKDFIDVMLNTIGLNLLQLCINFPAPIIFAILITEVGNSGFKKLVQNVTYFPYFISWIVFGGIILGMLSTDGGVVNDVLVGLGLAGKPVAFASDPRYFWGIIIITSLIKGLGWGSIIYIAAITGIDPSLYEAAKIDGAGRLQRIIKITLPCISGTILVFFLLSLSNLLSSGFDHIWVFQNPLNITRSEVIDTYVYKIGIMQQRYSFTTAVGLFKSVIAVILLSSGNFISKKFAGRGLF